MAYWVDEGFHGWPEVVRAGTAAAGLYSRCGSYIADYLTDGHIPAEVARMYGTSEWCARLVDVGLWTVEEHGYYDTRYFPLNPDAETVKERRKKAADRQKRYREKRDDKKTRHSRASNASRNASLTPPPTPSPYGEDARAREAGRGGASPVDKSVSDALRHPSESDCPHGEPRGPDHCGFCRRGLPAQEQS